MNDAPISGKEQRKARAMVRDISKQCLFNGEKLGPDEWWGLVFAGMFGQEVAPNPFHQDFPDSPLFIIRNKKRTKDLSVTTGAEVITALYAFGNARGVQWSDPKEIAEREQYERMAA